MYSPDDLTTALPTQIAALPLTVESGWVGHDGRHDPSGWAEYDPLGWLDFLAAHDKEPADFEVALAEGDSDETDGWVALEAYHVEGVPAESLYDIVAGDKWEGSEWMVPLPIPLPEWKDIDGRRVEVWAGHEFSEALGREEIWLFIYPHGEVVFFGFVYNMGREVVLAELP